MAGVQVFYLLTDEEIGFRKKKKSGFFVKSKKISVQTTVLGICECRVDARGSRKVMGPLRTLKKHI